VDAYVFEVSPKSYRVEEAHFLGRIWVDATDLQIVVTNGRMVQTTRARKRRPASALHDLARKVDGHYWFPVYTKGPEGILHSPAATVHVSGRAHPRHRQYSDYKRFGSTSTIIYNARTMLPSSNTSTPQAVETGAPRGWTVSGCEKTHW